MSYPFLKGHGTENDFVVLPDADGTVHGDLSADRVRALCDRRAGIGADGVLRAVRRDGGWFMDYRNADGSVSEMCGNGIRVFARYLHEREGEPFPMEVQTRDGVKVLDADGDDYTADMGSPEVLGETDVTVHGTSFPATHVSMGNPHAVVFVDNLAEAGALHEPPEHDDGVFPEGVRKRRAALDLHETAVGERQRDHGGEGEGLVRVEVNRRYVGAQAEPPSALRGLSLRRPGAGEDRGGGSDREGRATEPEHLTAGQ